MKPSFRTGMSWLHTWAGVVLGSLLFAIFWTGTLSVFDKEIDRWMAPITRLAITAQPFSFDALRPSLDAAATAGDRSWLVIPPTERQPVIFASRRDASGSVTVRWIDPLSGAELPDPGTLAGSGFLYPFHYMLHIQPKVIGVWLVGMAGMAMLALCVSGVVVHRKIFADFFTFRTGRRPRRAILDLHNVAGVIGLPFHIAITLSGLIIFFATYFPGVWQVVYPDVRTFGAELYGNFARPKSGRPAETAPLDAMAAQTRLSWEGEPRLLQAYNPGDMAAYVSVRRSVEESVAFSTDAASFDAATGTLLHRHEENRPMMNALNFIGGLHVIQFRHWTLRWLYFALGLMGCVMIATGYLFWLESRRKKHAQLGLSGVRIVDGLTVGSVAGIVIATLSFFVVNRLLPLGITLAGYDRAALEVRTFYLVWLVTFAHAWLRPRRAWIEQCWALAAFAVAAVLLNWITTGDHLIRSLSHRHLWPIAGMDSLLLAGAAIAALTARKLRHRVAAPPGRVPAHGAASRAAAE